MERLECGYVVLGGLEFTCRPKATCMDIMDYSEFYDYGAVKYAVSRFVCGNDFVELYLHAKRQIRLVGLIDCLGCID